LFIEIQYSYAGPISVKQYYFLDQVSKLLLHWNIIKTNGVGFVVVRQFSQKGKRKRRKKKKAQDEGCMTTLSTQTCWFLYKVGDLL
jgi:hypothetical protein